MEEKLQGTKLGEMKKYIDDSVEDYLKALGGSKAAGRRVRKNMLLVKELVMAIRKEVLENRQ